VILRECIGTSLASNCIIHDVDARRSRREERRNRVLPLRAKAKRLRLRKNPVSGATRNQVFGENLVSCRRDSYSETSVAVSSSIVGTGWMPERSRDRRVGSSSKRWSCPARLSTLPGSNRSPFSSCRTSSAMPPNRAATTGTRAAWASTIAVGRFSYQIEGTATTSRPLRIWPTCEFG